MSEWISVKERLPENDDDALVYLDADSEPMNAHWFGAAHGWWAKGKPLSPQPTFWMPLPPPPADPVREALRLARLVLETCPVESWMSPRPAEALGAIERAEKELDE